ncbi:MAG: hypothetical protein V4674_00480 [Patescibacteria group bacterium]
MEEEQESGRPVVGVPKQAFEAFLKALEEKSFPVDVISRLRKALIEKGTVSEPTIKNALFSDNNTDS